MEFEFSSRTRMYQEQLVDFMQKHVYTSEQIVAGAVGQQMGELGQEMARRGMDVQPTLEIRPGYRFSVMVTEDLELEPWQ